MALKISFMFALLAVWGILDVQTAFISHEKYYSWGRQKDNGSYPVSNFKLLLPPKVSNYTPLSSEFNFVWNYLDNVAFFIALVTKTPYKSNDSLKKRKWKIAVNIMICLHICNLLMIKIRIVELQYIAWFHVHIQVILQLSLTGIMVSRDFSWILTSNGTASYFKVTWKLN